jgi:phosphatidylglycerol---prolipoprotein diacylglyceryl transferase
VPLAAAAAVGLPLLQVGPLWLRPTGLLSAAGLLLGLLAAARAARRDGLDHRPLVRAVAVAAGAGVLGAHLVHLLAYHPEELADPWALLRLGEGLSSMGGLLGGAAGLALALRGRPPGLRGYADPLALGLAPGWAIGRVGCALVRDHPGRRTDFFLAAEYPDGLRHDLGTYEAALLLALSVALLALRRRGAARGRLLAVLALGYGAGRLALDVLRATDLPGADPRLVGLTPAQWLCLPLVAWAVAALRAPRPVW